MQGFPNSIKRWGEIPPTGEGGGYRNFAGGIFFTGGGIAQGLLLIVQGFCDAQINIPYILNIS